jgi:hypothetical protein
VASILFTIDEVIVSENDPELIRAKLNLETAKLGWNKLQRFFAGGKLLYLDSGLDLIDVAFAIQQDDRERVQHWMEKAQLSAVSDLQAKDWLANNRQLWVLVVKPWILVQLPQAASD